MKTHIYFIIAFAIALFSCSSGDDNMGDLPTLPDNPGTPAPGIGTGKILVVEDEFENQHFVIAGSKTFNFIVSFSREFDGQLRNFSAVQDELPVIMQDEDGNKWDIFGYATEGPDKGKRLVPTQSLMGYWFSFGTFYPGIELYPSNSKGIHDGKVIVGDNGWLVPSNEVRSGGVGRDGIPAVGNPQFESVSSVDFLENNDLVVAFRSGNKVKAYPHDVLDWHEIVNDSFDNLYFSIVYCPLTGTATIWDRTIDGKTTTFGVSGLLYNTNIVPYDRETSSNWSQLFDRSINGTNSGKRPKNYMPLETTWATFKALYPNAEVMNTNTGFNRSYGFYPYGDYKTSQSLIFPVKYDDDRLHPKERVHALIVNGEAKAYKFENFD